MNSSLLHKLHGLKLSLYLGMPWYLGGTSEPPGTEVPENCSSTDQVLTCWGTQPALFPLGQCPNICSTVNWCHDCLHVNSCTHQLSVSLRRDASVRRLWLEKQPIFPNVELFLNIILCFEQTVSDYPVLPVTPTNYSIYWSTIDLQGPFNEHCAHG